MGLGKTIELLSLVLSNPYDAPTAAYRVHHTAPHLRQLTTRATLVVVPLSLLSQWNDEVDKCVMAGAMQVAVWYPFDNSRLNKASAKAHELSSHDIVLTTYDAVLAETRASTDRLASPKVLLNRCWWRVVLDESQRVSKNNTLITRTCCALPRVHSWLLSGTPVGNVVEDLLGQLLFLRVEPFCRMGEGVDNFWEREVTSRFQAHDDGALEIVDELLGSIMMRHSKAQSLIDAGGVARPIISLPEMRTQDVAVVLADESERAVYLALEAYCQEEMVRIVAEQASPYIALIGLFTLLAKTANHSSLLSLSALDERLQRRIDNVASDQEARERAEQEAALPPELRLEGPRKGAKVTAAANAAKAANAITGLSALPQLSKAGSAGLLGAPRHLAAVLDELPSDAAGRASLEALLRACRSAPLEGTRRAEEAHECLVCRTAANEIARPVLLHCCLQVACYECATYGLDGLGGGGSGGAAQASARCMHCSTPLSPAGLTRLCVPLDSQPDAEPASASVPSAVAAMEALQLLPPQGRLAELRVWACCGAPCTDKLVPAGWRVCNLTVDGLHFCSTVCMRSRFRRALVQCGTPHTGSSEYQLQDGGPHGWPGPLARGRPRFPNVQAAEVELLKRAGPVEQGTPLYRSGKRACPLLELPNVLGFPQLDGTPSPASHFVAHYDAAGGARPYGMHGPWHTGSKLSAIAAAVRQMRADSQPEAGGSKAVVFSAFLGTLQLLQDLLSDEYGAGAVVSANGSLSQAERAEQIATFHAEAGCFVLLLTVGACASGLNLTVADHCFLVEPQTNASKELQLINRIYRIGQTRPVTVKKFFCAATVEERLLAVRKRRNSGLLAEAEASQRSEDDGAGPEADAMAVPVVGDSGEGGAEGGADGSAEGGAAMAMRIGDLRFVFGFESTDSAERPQAQAAERPQAQVAERPQAQAQAAERSLALAKAAAERFARLYPAPGRKAERLQGRAVGESKAIPKRTPGPYMLFCKTERPRIVEANPGIPFGEVGKALGAAWQKLSFAQKAEWGMIYRGEE